MTVLISGGDSFTYGNELDDCINNRYSEYTWAADLATHLGMSYDCTAWGGHGNSAIARRVMDAARLHMQENRDIFIAVMWSYPSRYEFRFTYDTLERGSPWYSITPWTHERNQSVILDAFKNFKETIFDHYKRNQLAAQSTGLADFSEHFYKDVGDSEYWEIYTSLKEIVFLQNWLTVKGIPYIFTLVDNCIFKPNIEIDVTLKTLYESVDMTKFFQEAEFEGFYKWAQEWKYPFGATHPLEPAHTDFALKILPFAEQHTKY